MKKVIKSIAAAFAAIIASTAMISSASAATYVDYYGNTYFDGINDGAVYYVDNLYGSYYSYQETYVGYDVFYGMFTLILPTVTMHTQAAATSSTLVGTSHSLSSQALTLTAGTSTTTALSATSYWITTAATFPTATT